TNESGPNRHDALVWGLAAAGVHGIDHKVDQDLLELDAIHSHRRQLVASVDLQLNLADRRVRARDVSGLRQQRLNLLRTQLDIPALQQSAQPIDDLAGAVIIVSDVGDDRAQFLEIR